MRPVKQQNMPKTWPNPVWLMYLNLMAMSLSDGLCSSGCIQDAVYKPSLKARWQFFVHFCWLPSARLSFAAPQTIRRSCNIPSVHVMPMYYCSFRPQPDSMGVYDGPAMFARMCQQSVIRIHRHRIADVFEQRHVVARIAVKIDFVIVGAGFALRL